MKVGVSVGVNVDKRLRRQFVSAFPRRYLTSWASLRRTAFRASPLSPSSNWQTKASQACDAVAQGAVNNWLR